MSLHVKTIEETIETIKNSNSSGAVYDVSGITQTRNGITFIENTFSAKVNYRENLIGPVKKVNYKVEDLHQSCSGLIFQFAAYFNDITSSLELAINEGYEVERILNLSEISQKWHSEKKILAEKFKTIPNLDKLLENYEKSIDNEEKLRNSIFYTGIAQLFFPRIKQLLQVPMESKKFFRKRNLQGFYFGIKVPIKEELSVVENYNDKITAHIVGSLDVESIEDKEHFLRAFRMLYGEGINMEDITFWSKEKYTMSRELVYETGEIDQYLEVNGVYFKKDKLSFKPSHNER
ncbi:hypothetical protein [Chryseobacterium rhizosphaerae]|uniref:Uncharacterized protein n=1 Tax=Chryseobacterium rhizosphaerae TaxID=395937 RepID=A0ABX9IJ04_9FLAO|nr:hypothetical protein [Chryseobacterium rhizosphaerae]REC74525.1 hypothetical protein DRF57_13600 [Chryseobacterium rhizosphaerae]GEN66007.1 hypothetical protein CRH01_05750 [Chryseobacterium rhizosphaerae]